MGQIIFLGITDGYKIGHPAEQGHGSTNLYLLFRMEIRFCIF